MDDKLKQDVERAVKSDLKMLQNNVIFFGETAGEIYVSSTLGMEDGPNKELMKGQYIEHYQEKVKQLL